MAERMVVSPPTYKRIEKGEATASLGIYAMGFSVPQIGMSLEGLVESSMGNAGFMFETSRLLKQVRIRRHIP